jgi:hypothetical protein
VAETTTKLITDEDFNAFEVALDRQTWPDGGRIVPITRRQMAAVRAALEAAAGEVRARWVAEALDTVVLGLQDQADTEPRGRDARARVDTTVGIADLIRRLADEYRNGQR